MSAYNYFDILTELTSCLNDFTCWELREDFQFHIRSQVVLVIQLRLKFKSDCHSNCTQSFCNQGLISEYRVHTSIVGKKITLMTNFVAKTLFLSNFSKTIVKLTAVRRMTYFVVPTSHGNIKGKTTQTKGNFSYHAFYKIPFAKPPVADLR